MTSTVETRFLFLSAALALLGSGCRGDGSAADLGTEKNAPVIVVSIDTLRSDRLPAYGSKRIETPAFDALAREGIVYERAYSQIPLTLPSHASILTGQFPVDHGVRDNTGYLFAEAAHPYLPRLLKGAGFATGAAVSSFVLRGETGLAAGFDYYEGSIDLRTGEALGRSQRPGGETATLALDWAKAQGDKPFFLLLHLYEPHTPYEPVEPFRSRYADRYDAEIATADAIVGRFLEGLRAAGIYDRSTLILLSDHGEGLGDHGEEEHGILLYREALQVPLIMKLPGGRLGGRRVATPVALVDVTPTVLELAGVPLPAGLDGRILPVTTLDSKSTGSTGADRTIYAETFYPRLHLGWSELTSLIRGPHHLIQGPVPELFDLVADPAETRDILRAERRTYSEMRAELAKIERPLAKPAEIDPETAQKLAALGYLGGTSVADTGEALPDPKSRIASLADFGSAMQAVSDQRFSEAIPRLTRLVAENPKMVDAWIGLAVAQSRVGRPREAFKAYEKAMEVTGGSSQVAIGAASVLISLGRLDEAEKYAEIGMKSSPSAGRDLMAQIAEARGDLAGAEKQIRLALEGGGSRITPLIALARLLQKQGKTEEALEHANQALADLARTGGRHEGLQTLRGDLLGRLDRPAEAEAAFADEIGKYPASLMSYTRLATLYAAQGKASEAVGMLRRMTDTNKTPAAYGEAVRTLRVLGDKESALRLLRYAQTQFPESRELRRL